MTNRVHLITYDDLLAKDHIIFMCFNIIGDNMPAKSKAQRTAMEIAEHAPSKLFKRNKGLKKMSKKQLHDFAATKAKGLPKRVKKGK